jgi:predicted transcriptional regulator
MNLPAIFLNIACLVIICFVLVILIWVLAIILNLNTRKKQRKNDKKLDGFNGQQQNPEKNPVSVQGSLIKRFLFKNSTIKDAFAPLLTLVCAIAIGLLQYYSTRYISYRQETTQRDIAKMQIETQTKYADLKALIDSNQIKISQGQVIVSLFDHIVRGTQKEQDIAFIILEATGNYKTAQKIFDRMAKSGNNELRQKAVNGIKVSGEGEQALATIEELRRTSTSESEKKEAAYAKESVIRRTLENAQVYYDHQAYNAACDEYRQVIKYADEHKLDKNELDDADLYFSHGAYKDAADKYRKMLSRTLKSE